MDLVTVKNNQIAVAQAVVEALQELKKIEDEYNLQKEIVEQYKDQIRNAMEQNGIKKVEIPTEENVCTITYFAPTVSVKKEVDFTSLKEQGLYDDFVTEKPSKRSSYIKVNFK